MKLGVVVVLLLALCVLHQDFWWRNDPTPVLGFLPVGLAWHIGISVAAAVVWWLAVRFCWPAELEEGVVDLREGPAPRQDEIAAAEREAR